MKTKLSIISLLIINFICSQVPTITGDFILCPNGISILSTQSYETYQWEKREYGSSNTIDIVGEVNQDLTIDYSNYTLSHISVQVTINGESYTSNEVFIDGYAFIPLHVQIDGVYDLINGEITLTNPNDYVIFTVLNPFNTNVLWYKDGVIIPNQNTSSIQVNLPGVYSVSASPSQCLNYLETSLPLVVQTGNLGNEIPEIELLTIYPNPVQNILFIDPDYDFQNAEVYDLLGKKVTTNQVSTNTIDVSKLAQGMYIIKVISENNKTFSSKFIKE